MTLEKELEKRDINYALFANTTEDKRKKMLGEDYQEVKTEYGWLYDQPINKENQKLANQTPAPAKADKEQAALNKKAEALAEKESKSRW